MAAKTRTKRPARDTYQEVTDRIITALEEGVVPWHRPWSATDGPTSLSSGKPYRGVNVFLLGLTAMSKGYASKWWGTYRQIAERGGQVRKGEKGSPVVFWKVIEKRDAAGEITDRIPFLRYFTVFNAEQADDLTIPEEPDRGPAPEKIAACEMIRDGYLLRETELRLTHGGNSAYYSPGLDQVNLPPMVSFESAESYYGVMFHEFGHSTGCEKRLNRPGFHSGHFGNPDYSREELVAEMTAAFVCGAAGIDVNVPAHAGYIGNWLAALKDDKKLLVSAAGAAQRAADLILGPQAAARG